MNVGNGTVLIFSKREKGCGNRQLETSKHRSNLEEKEVKVRGNEVRLVLN
jgi:hypothetical protein